VRSSASLRIADRLLWVEQGSIAATDPLRTSLAGLAGLPIHATLWCFGPTLAAASVESLSARMPWREDLRAGTTVISYNTVQSLHLIRCTGLHAEDVRNLLVDAWMILRRDVLGVGGTPLRLWST
ncbi:MAG TPA: urease accessory protein, partial [Castellaniella sp.]|nr:urease accessory protein [Castellaniella sp.]